MKKAFQCVLFCLFVVAVSCSEQEEPLICHLYGYIKDSNDSLGVNNMILRIYDIDPYDVYQGRLRYDTTMTHDDSLGFFEMDSVCYGTNKRQGNLVTIAIDESENPNWPSQFYTPDIDGGVDTVRLYILPED